jgi:transcriptional regulator with PAS, ATPase and Fis domain
MNRSILLIADDPGVVDVAGQLRINGWDVHVEEPMADSLSEVTRRHVSRVLERNKGNRQRTAKALGVTRATLYKWLKDWGMERFGR